MPDLDKGTRGPQLCDGPRSWGSSDPTLLNPYYHQAVRVSSCTAPDSVTKIHKLRTLHLSLGTGQRYSRWPKEAMSQGMQLPNLHWGWLPVGAVRPDLGEP